MSDLVVYAGNNKSGMEGMDEQRQKEIIKKASEGSAYIEHASKLDDKHIPAIKRLKAKKETFSAEKFLQYSSKADKKVREIETTRSFERHFVVLDFDAFYANVEVRDRPDLRGKPIAVGMGLVTTSSYEARKFGVRAGMPTFVAKKLCPHLISVPTNFDKYKEASEHMKNVILEYDSNPSMCSLDEIIFDLTDSATARYMEEHPKASDRGRPSNASLRKVVEVMVTEIREKIKVLTRGLTSSAGIANNVTLAKIGSSVKKPDGQFSLEPTRKAVLAFLQTLPLRSVPGIGRVFEKYLRECGFVTCGDVLHQLGMCLYLFERGDKSPDFLCGTCLGIAKNEGKKRPNDNDLPDNAVTRRSISCERTFNAVYTGNEMMIRLLGNIESLSKGMKAKNLEALTVTLKMKTAKYDVFSRAVTLTRYIQSASDIEAAAMPLFEGLMKGGKMTRDGVRLIGVSCSKFKGGLTREEREGARLQPKMDAFLKASSSSSSSSTSGPTGGSASDPVLLLSSQSDDEDDNNSVDMDTAYHSQSQEEVQGQKEDEGEEGAEEMGSGSFLYPADEDEDEDGDDDGAQDLRNMAAASASMTTEMKRAERDKN